MKNPDIIGIFLFMDNLYYLKVAPSSEAKLF